jgi:hypothetical protein
MAGIKETKDQLRQEVFELYKRFTTGNPQQLFSAETNHDQLHAHAELAAQLAKKIEALACLSSVEEEKPVIIPVVPEIKMSENNIPQVLVPIVEEKIIPPVAETKKPEIIPPTPPPAEKKFPELKSFIGFNEKLMFIRNLFKGDSNEYENALALLNNCVSFREAEAVLQNLSSSHAWSPENEAVQTFHSIVKRRFA